MKTATEMKGYSAVRGCRYLVDIDKLLSNPNWVSEVPENRLRELGYGGLEGVADYYVKINDPNWIYECSEKLQQRLSEMSGMQLKLQEWEMEMLSKAKERSNTVECYNGGRVNVRAVVNAIRRNQPLQQTKCYIRTEQVNQQYKGCMVNTSLPIYVESDINKIVERLKARMPKGDGLYFIRFFDVSKTSRGDRVCMLHSIEYQSIRPNKDIAKIFCPQVGCLISNIVAALCVGDFRNLYVETVDRDNIINLS